MNPKDNIVAQNLQDGHELESGAFDKVSDSVDVQVLPSEIDLANQTLLPDDVYLMSNRIDSVSKKSKVNSLGKLEEI